MGSAGADDHLIVPNHVPPTDSLLGIYTIRLPSMVQVFCAQSFMGRVFSTALLARRTLVTEVVFDLSDP
jgi:hypothetical protein